MKISSAEFVLSASHDRQLRRDGLPEVGFVGRSNVGKSSLMNRLLGRRGLARTSSTPGRTQAVNYFLVNRRFYFVDLPGFGYAKAPRNARQRWAELMNTYFRHRRTVAGEAGTHLLHLVDGKVGATDLDVQASEYFAGLELDPRVVVTKIDKVPRSRRARQLKSIGQQLDLPSAELVAFSAVSGEGTKELWSDIEAFLTAKGKTVTTTATT